MSDFVKQLEAVVQITRDVRRTLVKEQYRICIIDKVCGTHLMERWLGTQEGFGSLIDTTERSAIHIVGKMRAYLNVIPFLTEHDVLENIVDELISLQKVLPNFRFSDHEGKRAVALHLELHSLRVDIQRTDCDVLMQKEIEEAETEVTDLEQKLFVTGEEIKKLEAAPSLTLLTLLLRIVRFLWGTSAAVANNRGELRRIRLEQEQTSSALASAHIRVAAAQQTLDSVDLAGLLQTTEKIERDLVHIAELLDSVWSQATNMLLQEINSFLACAKRYKDNPTTGNQLALDAASQEVLASSALWEQRAIDLEDKYAKAST